MRRRTLLGSAPLWAASAQAQQEELLLVNAPYPPFVLEARDPIGEGLDVDIARAALARAGYSVRLALVPWRRALQMLEAGEADLTTTISLSGERERFLLFSEGYRSTVRYHFYSRRGSGLRVERLEDLAQVSLGYSAGFFYPPAIKQAVGRGLVEGRDLEVTVRMLNAGRSDLIVVNHLAGLWTIRRLGLEAQLERQPFSYSSGSPTYMALSRKRHGDGRLLNTLNEGLRALVKDGTLARLEARYLPP
ncbi:substrate-binding periplasmic protein [Inhella proteolytica]|uniref:Transporter substrate-binding domain-containing protein n=1 Tax=Inhella proteolytica TaxID=2795029 RepID=A0A931NC98_9BURK|nr:transporter substrate-binding domain-containing protein [Inhella proteolytica]MBH9575342.1 transporter substrate-binding domain-containing protein [Inhella proteolytica]